MTRLHLVNGFLGSGKTTAIVAAARQHLARGERVGVVTNDQGRYLVDTAFVSAQEIPVVQVTGGCFCCSYDQLLDVLDSLATDAHPDVIYAESVGSCADLVETVVEPLRARGDRQVLIQSLSVYADARLLLRHLQGLPLPFSDDVIYILDRQLDEAGVLVLNKMDLLGGGALDELIGLARRRLPGRPVLAQDSRPEGSVAAWLDLIESGGAGPHGLSEPVDYDRYGEGEMRLAWIDRTLRLAAGDGRQAVIVLIQTMLQVCREHQSPVAHLKCSIVTGEGSSKVSVTWLEQPGWSEAIPALEGEVQLLLNLRLESASEAAEAMMDETLSRVLEARGDRWETLSSDTFSPRPPRRTDRR